MEENFSGIDREVVFNRADLESLQESAAGWPTRSHLPNPRIAVTAGLHHVHVAPPAEPGLVCDCLPYRYFSRNGDRKLDA